MQPIQSELATLGGFFALATHQSEPAPAPPWRPLTELLTEPAVLRDRFAMVRAGLATSAGLGDQQEVPARVAASVSQLGLVARIVSPALAVAVLSGQVLGMELADLRWQPLLGGAFPLSVWQGVELQGQPLTGAAGPAQPGGEDAEVAQLAGLFAATVLAGPVAELTAAVQRACPVSPLVVWGNVASAVNGAASMIAAGRPMLAARSFRLSRAILRQRPLSIPDAAAGAAFRRRSCCLIYRTAPGRWAVCGDCVLRAD
ncbi:MAG: (2Fe-2S)-binding protein [Actinomycetota bacterium]|nr:(2Fe-2S)-binding protein [Actinomycetota bacterium]